MRSAGGGTEPGRRRPGRGLCGGAVAALILALPGCASERGIEEPVPLEGSGTVAYPLAMSDRKIEGVTLLRAFVNAEGGVDTAMVGASSGHPEFDSAALAGARTMHFQPAARHGRPLGVWVRFPVHFRQDRSEAEAGPVAR